MAVASVTRHRSMQMLKRYTNLKAYSMVGRSGQEPTAAAHEPSAANAKPTNLRYNTIYALPVGRQS